MKGILIPEFTKQEDQFILDNKYILNNKQIANALKRSEYSISQRKNKLIEPEKDLSNYLNIHDFSIQAQRDFYYIRRLVYIKKITNIEKVYGIVYIHKDELKKIKSKPLFFSKDQKQFVKDNQDKFSNKQLASKLNVSLQTISNIKNELIPVKDMSSYLTIKQFSEVSKLSVANLKNKIYVSKELTKFEKYRKLIYIHKDQLEQFKDSLIKPITTRNKKKSKKLNLIKNKLDMVWFFNFYELIKKQILELE